MHREALERTNNNRGSEGMEAPTLPKTQVPQAAGTQAAKPLPAPLPPAAAAAEALHVNGHEAWSASAAATGAAGAAGPTAAAEEGEAAGMGLNSVLFVKGLKNS
ncbi:hypothetical protein COCSUDRAFT_60511 [Coccomyxa subellipsoidea C-169]|uniref:Uncharacterized protein n=1 Tax=Coccomyxa subellipsoidea (strain C-169) TaxID=574566 RepID=I0YIB8_COCSC|nr:hypothetical protein COCSUDRAFT_60511 [Coccomyxa subellipsoidea C-169]EIE18137.1 hypothetical protein COCSUDRAFT_60511 [Coccomyxa subellipsoidea C-169]|eukprot:XP_005642681.1 hypothetical protein COCSUDRAFT_60511 [Coccomyxa subellipsoidea C-169]